MVVQHNLTAMNSNRMLGLTTASQAKSTERLSSGYKINRAADDAAGLSISEKMRKQMRGLTQATANAQDGISAVQTAEGALNEVQDMLQRMNELAVKSANGTNSESDRNAIQSEIDQLVTEIDRVSTTTKFNETYLLKGTDTNNTYKLSFSKAGGASLMGIASANYDDNGKAVTAATAQASVYVAAYTPAGATAGVAATLDAGYSIAVNASSFYLHEGAVQDAIDQQYTGNSYGFGSKEDFITAVKNALRENDSTGSLKNLTLDTKNAKWNLEAFADVNRDLKFSLHVGADSESSNKIDLSVKMLSARGLGVNALRLNGTDDSKATAAIDTITRAQAIVSNQRANLGAIQNRLEHTINNLDNIVENTTSAESQIRDTDMATEMVKYANNNILAQAGQSMLAQANQSNQGILSLLG